MTNKIKNTLIIDLDNTLTVDDSSVDYAKKLLNKSISHAINNAISLGYESTIFSARNMRSFKGDLHKIESITRPIAEKWLNDNDIKYNDLILGKPWCGLDGWYLDDKNISIEEFIFKFSGPYWDKTINILIPFFNEENNIKKTHEAHKRVEKFFNVTGYVYVNNGSSDNTLEILEEIASLDKKITIVSIKSNIGYGNGLKEGLMKTSSDMVLINHADLQFDPYAFFYSNLEAITSLEKPTNIFSNRLNRKKSERINSSILRVILSLIYFNKISDFNGQPKLIFKNTIKEIKHLSNNFCIDLDLYNKCRLDSILLPIIQKERFSGESSWNKNIFKRIKIFSEYISHALKDRNNHK